MTTDAHPTPAPGQRGTPDPRHRRTPGTSSVALDLVGLTPLMQLTSGAPEVGIGLIDGPVALDHPALSRGRVREVVPAARAACTRPDSAACMHGTFVAGVLSATRDSAAPAICPDCTLLVRPIFTEAEVGYAQVPNASPEELASAIVDCVEGGARILNLSIAVSLPSKPGERVLMQALDHAAQRGVIAVVAAGNQGTVGSSLIARHPWMIAVAACDLTGRPLSYTNLGNSIGRRGLTAPGDNIASLGVGEDMPAFGGTSVAAPFVTGTVALLWSLFPSASAGQIKTAVAPTRDGARRSVAPPLLDAWQAYLELARTSPRRAGRAWPPASR